MKASELKPRQFFHFTGDTHKQLCRNIGTAYQFLAEEEMSGNEEVTPLDVQGWNDEPSPTMEGYWSKDCLQRAFVEGAKWWECHCESATMWQSDRNLAEQEAVKRYGQPTPAQPPKLQLREGGWYRTQDQRTIGPAKFKPQNRYDNYPWCLNGAWYNDRGQYCAGCSGVDLIAEVPPSPIEQFGRADSSPTHWTIIDGVEVRA